MGARRESDSDVLLAAAAQGNRQAVDRLLERHRPRLRRLIRLRLDRRLAARVDPSDVVQESLADAAAKLNDYLRTRPMRFYPWLRSLALERLVSMYRWHIRTSKRSVRREERALPPLPDESALELAQQLCVTGSSPSQRLAQSEARARVRAALELLSEQPGHGLPEGGPQTGGAQTLPGSARSPDSQIRARPPQDILQRVQAG
jgi:RNA polymerase sigma-70 factor (ECF subfamily)